MESIIAIIDNQVNSFKTLKEVIARNPIENLKVEYYTDSDDSDNTNHITSFEVNGTEIITEEFDPDEIVFEGIMGQDLSDMYSSIEILIYGINTDGDSETIEINREKILNFKQWQR